MRSVINMFRRIIKVGGMLPLVYAVHGVESIRVRYVPFNRLAGDRGNKQVESASEPSGQDLRRARIIGLTVEQVSGRVPWTTSCLINARTVHQLMRLFRIEHILILGIKKDIEGMKAHAWLDCGCVTVIGGEQADEYAPIGRFHCCPGRIRGRG